MGGMSSAAQVSGVRSALSDALYNVIFLIETCFSSAVMSSEVFSSDDWLVTQCDRSGLRDLRRAGGVLIVVRRSFVTW